MAIGTSAVHVLVSMVSGPCFQQPTQRANALTMLLELSGALQNESSRYKYTARLNVQCQSQCVYTH